MQKIQTTIAGGKTLCVHAEKKDSKLEKVYISGDFFLSPPEGIHALEEAIQGFVSTDTQALQEVLMYVVQREDIRMHGFDENTIVQLIQQLP